MRNRIIALMFAVIFLASLASAEIYLWTDTLIDEDASTVTHYSYYQLKDTSGNEVLHFKEVPVFMLWNVQELPFDLTPTYNGSIDWCNLTIIHYKNDFNSDGNIINTTSDLYEFNYTTGNATFGTFQLELKDLDSITAEFTCHHTDPNYLFVENIYGGHMSVFVPAFSCEGCGDFTFEELTQENEKLVATIDEELEIYKSIQSVVEMNYAIWLIGSWLFKIAVVFLAMGVVFFMFYYVFQLLKRAGEGRR